MSILFGGLILALLIFLGFIVMSVWIVSLILRGTGRLIFGRRQPTVPRVTMILASTQCVRAGCEAANPSDASFCRRCGSQLPTKATNPFYPAGVAQAHRATSRPISAA